MAADTIIALTKERVYIIASSKKASILEPLCEPCAAQVGVKLKLVPKSKSEDGSAQVEALMGKIKGTGGPLGCLAKEKPDGKLAGVWAAAVAASGLATVDVAAGLSDVLSCKDEGEVKNVKRASFLLVNAMKGVVVPEMERIIDEERKVKHTALSEKTEKVRPPALAVPHAFADLRAHHPHRTYTMLQAAPLMHARAAIIYYPSSMMWAACTPMLASSVKSLV